MNKTLEMIEKRNQAWNAAKAFVESRRDKDGLLSEADAKTYAEMEQKVRNYSAEIERLQAMEATLLANQSILIHNLKNRDEKKPLLTEEDVELLTVPSDLAEYKAAITEAMYKGTKRNIESEEDSKNTAAG